MEKKEIEYIEIKQEEEEFLPHDDPEIYLHDPSHYKYVKSLNDSEGFDIYDDPDSEFFGMLRHGHIDCKETAEPANFAIEEFNRLKGTTLELVKTIRVNWTIVCGVLSYLTLECTYGCFYEARVYEPFGKSPILGIFRPAKYYNPSSSDGKTTSTKSENSEDGDAEQHDA